MFNKKNKIWNKKGCYNKKSSSQPQFNKDKPQIYLHGFENGFWMWSCDIDQ